MQEKLIKYLNITRHQLEMYVFNHYFLWCELQAINDQDLQNILANKKINAWFMEAYHECQLKFIKQVEKERFLTAEQFKRLYKIEVFSTIQNLYPKHLIQQVRKTNYSIYGTIASQN